MKQLQFVSIEFTGIDRIEPEFSPLIKEYTIFRQAGDNFNFKAELNEIPQLRNEDNSWNYRPFEGYSLEYHESESIYKSFWSVGEWNRLQCPPGMIGLWFVHRICYLLNFFNFELH